MGISRYNKVDLFRNTDASYRYSDILKRRNLGMITQRETPNLKFPSPDEINEMGIETKVWTAGEKYFKLAHEYYGDPSYWWIIAWYNEIPLDTDVNAGDIIEIPTPLELILEYLDIV